MVADPAPTQGYAPNTVSMLGPGATVAGRFVVEHVAGSGGVGVVYRARDRQTGLPVALKVMQHLDREALGRFEREASTLAALSHPGIVRHVAHGTTDDAQPFLAMEWLEGEDLAHALARGALSVRDGVSLVKTAAEALGAAHTRGLVHRDIKPANLFLLGRRVDGVRVLDFGLVRPEGASRDLTQTGAVLGTPGYMAPEQARGGRDVDARADVFALGCVLFECLAGVPPFRGRNAVEVLSAILMDPAPRLRSLRPEVPDGLDALVARMLSKQPDARPDSAVAVALELAALENAAGAAAGQKLFRIESRRVFEAPADFLFAVFADSNRFDRLTGAPRTRYTYEAAENPGNFQGETVRIGHAEMMGAEVSWTEEGEWLEPTSAWGERRFRDGVPATRLGLEFEVEPAESGSHEVRLSAYVICEEQYAHVGAMLEAVFARQIARYFDALAALLARVDLATVPRAEGEGPGAWVRRALLRAGHDKVLSGPRGEVRAAEFEQRARALDEAPADSRAREKLVALVRDGADEHLRELRPFELARAWDLPPREVLRACLYAARAGILDLRWEMICPTCRVGAASEGALAALGPGSYCAECQKDFALDMASNVEAVFTVNRALREVESSYYCASSPAFRPHVFASLRLGGRETREVMARLPAGTLRVRAAHRPGSAVFGSDDGDVATMVRVRLGAAGITAENTGATLSRPPEGTVSTLVLANETDAPALIVIERETGPRDAVTGTAMCALPEFLDLFSAEAPAAGRELAVSTVALVALEVTGTDALCARIGDARAYAAVAHAQAHLEELFARHGGAVLRAAGDAFLACFTSANEAEPAARAAIEALRESAARDGWTELSARAGVAQGPCLMVRVRGKLDVFGRTDAAAWRALAAAEPGGVKRV